MAVFLDVATCSLGVGFTMMMEAVRSSEMSVNIYQTASYNILGDSHLHTHCCENVKFYKNYVKYINHKFLNFVMS
jgi:hypothetical protein